MVLNILEERSYRKWALMAGLPTGQGLTIPEKAGVAQMRSERRREAAVAPRPTEHGLMGLPDPSPGSNPQGVGSGPSLSPVRSPPSSPGS